MSRRNTSIYLSFLTIGTLSIIGILFSPLIYIYFPDVSSTTPNLTIYGITTSGETQHLAGIVTAQGIQLFFILVLMLNFMLAFFNNQKLRMIALTANAFILSMAVAWIMLYVEGIIEPQVGAKMTYTYTFGFIFACIALFCTAFSITCIEPIQQRPKLALQTEVLDQDF